MNERRREKARKSANGLAPAASVGQDAEMPGKPFQSKLNPHLDEIRTLRRGRKTWQEIADTITARHGIKTNASSVYEFARRRANRPAPFGFDEEPPAGEPANATAPAAVTGETEKPQKLAIQKPRTRPPVQERKKIFDFSTEEIDNLERNPILPTDKTE